MKKTDFYLFHFAQSNVFVILALIFTFLDYNHTHNFFFQHVLNNSYLSQFNFIPWLDFLFV